MAIAAVEADPSSPGITWSLQPSSQEGPDGRVSLRQVVAGGETASDHVALTNYSAVPAVFAVYASDGTVTADGTFDLIPGDEAATGGGSWITIPAIDGATPRADGGIAIEVPAETTVVLPVDVRVPADATPGDHPAGIVAELIVGDSFDVELSSRVGVRVHLRVAGDIVAQLTPVVTDTTYSPSWNPFAPSTVTVQYEITNSGNLRLGAATEVSMNGPLGLASATVDGGQREILPGQAAVETVELVIWPLALTSGTLTADPSLVGTDTADTTLSPASTAFTVVTVPWSQLALVVLVLCAAFLVRALRRRSAVRIQARIDAAVASATAQDGNVDRAEGDPVGSVGHRTVNPKHPM
ncbi:MULTISPECIES: hypothetical protein [unclassified Microbacterium]|uniref:COG1470 family protein n=1 Tax=unclassified Microbacterium TaxID=2609290 RepID=UPI00214AEB18|nr:MULTISPECIES: hypothetical protein [unclassified Microbacterium]MCR2786090.1 hypothetical protein [Microbacterium sp. zg.B96]WIM17024.1 hypothetical protein QNO11_05135 [Microbacterium sp. zg-B96]